MPGLEPTVAREPLHRRAIEIRGYKREDGLYDIEGHLVDSKGYDFKVAAGVRHAGEPVHDMWLRITVDRELKIVDAAAAMDAMPYVDHCNQIVPAYKLLIGLAKGRKNYDKREVEKNRDWNREKSRILKDGGRA